MFSGAILGKLFTYVPLLQSSINWHRCKLGQSGVTLAMPHRHGDLSTYGLNDLKQGDEHRSYDPLAMWHLPYWLAQVSMKLAVRTLRVSACTCVCMHVL